jgi:hypothetical protein
MGRKCAGSPPRDFCSRSGEATVTRGVDSHVENLAGGNVSRLSKKVPNSASDRSTAHLQTTLVPEQMERVCGIFGQAQKVFSFQSQAVYAKSESSFEVS